MTTNTCNFETVHLLGNFDTHQRMGMEMEIDEEATHVTTTVKATEGYLYPE